MHRAKKAMMTASGTQATTRLAAAAVGRCSPSVTASEIRATTQIQLTW